MCRFGLGEQTCGIIKPSTRHRDVSSLIGPRRNGNTRSIPKFGEGDTRAPPFPSVHTVGPDLSLGIHWSPLILPLCSILMRGLIMQFGEPWNRDRLCVRSTGSCNYHELRTTRSRLKNSSSYRCVSATPMLSSCLSAAAAFA